METVFCKSCGCTKSRDEFHKAKREKNGLQFRCKTCDKKWHADRYIRDKEKISEQTKKWKRDNSEKVFEISTLWKKNNPDRIKSYQRITNLRKNFGLEVYEYEKMFKEQNGVCFLCGESEVKRNHLTKELLALAVDHCHEKGTIRRLLCAQCNHGLGFFKDNSELLRKAANYIESFR
jgi:hypothetical protein